SSQPRQAFGRKLNRKNIDHELPLRRRRWELADEVGRILRKIFTDEHDRCTQFPEIMGHSQVLVAHLRLINPHAKPYSLFDNLLWSMAKAARAHCGRGHFHSFFPQEMRFMAGSYTAAACKEIVRRLGPEPGGLFQLRLPEFQTASSFTHRVDQRGDNRREACRSRASQRTCGD